MMTVTEVMAELELFGDDNIKRILVKHGLREPLFGVKVEHLKKIQKKIKMDYQLANELYATGNNDAMYLAGLIADDEKMSRSDLHTWVKNALSSNISGYTVPWVATGSKYGYELALEWINSPDEHIAAAGWSTLSGLVSVKPDEELDINALRGLLNRVADTIHASDNRVVSAMNLFIINAGSYVTALTDDAIDTAKKIGKVKVDKNGTACKVPDAAEYINKVKSKGSIGKKKKEVKC